MIKRALKHILEGVYPFLIVLIGGVLSAGTLSSDTAMGEDNYRQSDDVARRMYVFSEAPEIEISDIEVEASAYACSRLVTENLRCPVDGTELSSLTWTMTGAVTAHSVSQGINQLSSYVFNVGETRVTYHGKYRNGQTFSAAFTVRVIDREPPYWVHVPGDVQAVVDEGECGTRVYWKPPRARDNCVDEQDLVVRSNFQPGDFFEVGEHEIRYDISDGNNHNVSRFLVKVLDEQAPEITSPRTLKVKCGEVPDAFTSWKEYEAAGGSAKDNCEIDYTSFRYVGQTSSGVHCPYTVTRIYEIADRSGNVARAKHLILVEEPEPEKQSASSGQSNRVQLKSATGAKNVTVTVVTVKDVSCYGGSDGYIDLDTSSTNGPITSISWQDGVTTLDRSGLSAGVYTVEVTDGDGTTRQTITIRQPEELIVTASGVDVNCNGGNDGSASVVVSGGTEPYSYLWSNGSTTSSISNLTVGTYSVTVTDVRACSKSASVTIGQPSVLSASETHTTIDCFGGTSRVTVMASGGTSPYQYSINNGTSWQSSNIFSGLAAGNYTIRVRDAHACIYDLPVTITQPEQVVISSVSADQPDLCEGENLQLHAVASGGTGVLSYSWLGPDGSTYSGANPVVANISSLQAGTYALTVSDVRSCTASSSVVITVRLNHNIALSSGSDDQTVCINHSIGTIRYTLGGGATGATVSGLPSGVTSSVSGGVLTISGTPTVSGTYNYTVTTTGNSCIPATATGRITVNPDHSIALSSGSDDQTVCINHSMGTIRYTLGGGATGATVSGLPTGVTSSVSGGVLTISGTPTVSGTYNYTVTTTGNSCITKTATGRIEVQPDHSIALSSGSDDQTVCINYAMGTIRYSLGGGATGATVSGLPSGVTSSVSGGVLTISGTPTVSGTFNYTVTTTGNSCIPATATGRITVNPDHSIALSSGSDDQTVCINYSIGTIRYTLEGGATGATVSGLPTGVTSSVSGGVLTISGTPTVSGTYNYTVTTTGNSCITATATGRITVDPDHSIALSSGSDDQTVCINHSMGTIRYTLGGGATGATVSGLPSGVTSSVSGGVLTISGTPTVSGTYNYTVTTTGNSCIPATATGRIEVQPDHTITLSSGNANQTVCWGDAVGNIVFVLGGGATNASVSGLPAGLSTSLSGGQYEISGTPTESGTFNFTVTTSGNGCNVASASGTIIIRDPLQAPVVSAAQEICYNTAPAALVASPAIGGSGPFTYQWQQSSNGSSWLNIPGGVTTIYSPPALTSSAYFRVIATDAGTPSCGSVISNAIFIDVAPELTASDAATAISCNGGTATVTLSAAGGTPPYVYRFNGISDAGGVIPNVVAGTYNWTVTDARNCGPITGTITISQPDVLSGTIALVSPIACFGGQGQVQITATGGTPPYQYSFNNSPYQSGNTFNVSAGTGYAWKVRDINGCEFNTGQPIDVAQPTQLSAVAVATDVSCHGGSDGAINLTVSGGTTPYSYAWNNGSNSEDPQNLSAGTYSVTVTDANGCTATASVEVKEPSPLNVGETHTEILCFGDLSDVTVSASGGVAPYEYSRDGGINWQSGNVFSSLAAGSYTFTVRDANGCTQTVAHTISQPAELVLSSIAAVDNELCEGSDLSLQSSATGGTGTLTYSWQLPDGSTRTGRNPLITNVTTVHDGTYSLTVTDANGCSVTGSVVVTVHPTPTVQASPTTQEFCSGGTTGISLTGTVPGTTFSWVVDATGVAGASDGNGNSITQTLIATGDEPGTVTYSITPHANGCDGSPISVEVTVNPIPVVTLTPENSVFCNESEVRVALNSNVNGTTYSWTREVVSGTISGGSSSGTTSSQILQTIDAGSGGANIRYLVTPEANGCVGNQDTAYVEFTWFDVDRNFNISGTSDNKVVCPGEDVRYRLRSRNGSFYFVRFYYEIDNPNIGLNPISGGPLGSGYSSGQQVQEEVRFTVENNTGVEQSGTIVFTVAAFYRWGGGYLCDVITRRRRLTVEPFKIECPSDYVVNTDPGNCGASVNVADPVVTCPPPTTLSWSMSGATTGSSAASGVNYMGTQTFNEGVTTVTYAAEDAFGNTSTCSFDVEVTDDEAPVVNCPGDVLINSEPDKCGATFNYSVTASDNCSYTLTQTDGTGLTSGSIFPVGTTTLSYEAVDPAGNRSSCFFDVTVEDVIAPVIANCPGDQTVCTEYGQDYFNVLDWDPTASDNCPGIVSLTYSLAGATTGTGTSLDNVRFSPGVTTVTWTATDAAGNSSTCSFEVNVQEMATVLSDPSDATVCIGSSVTFSVSAGGTVPFTYQWMKDGVDIPGATASTLTLNNLTGSESGQYSVTVSNGCNSTVSGEATLNVLAAPTVVVQPADQTDCEGESVEFSVTAGGGDGNYSYQWQRNSGSGWTNLPGNAASLLVSNIGDAVNPDQTQYRVIVTDGCGQQVTSGAAMLTVNRMVPQSVVSEMVCQKDGATSFHVQTAGSTPVAYEWTLNGNPITDNAVYSGSSTQTLTITNPDFSEAGIYAARAIFNITQPNNNGAGVTACTASFIDVGQLTIDDGPAIVALPASQSVCPNSPVEIRIFNSKGTPGTTYSWTRNNAHILPGNFTESWVADTLVLTGSLASLDPQNPQTTTFSITAVANGCVSSATVDVIVFDNTKPVVTAGTCPSDIVLNTSMGNCNNVVNYVPPTFDDNCDGSGLAGTLVAGLAPGSVFPFGTTTVKYVYEDAAGNVSDTCAFDVIIQDNTAPEMHCKDATVYLDNSGAGLLNVSDIDDGTTDDCTLQSLTINRGDFDCSNTGANIVTLTARDASGNENTCTATVTVLDTISPQITCNNFDVYLDASGNASIAVADVSSGASDNCGVQGVGLSNTTFDCTSVGPNTVTVTVSDVNGNSTSCVTEVTVYDTIAPQAVCQDVVLALNASGNAVLTTGDVDNGTSDACGIQALSLSKTMFDCSDIGTQVVTLTAQDVNGNVGQCTANVTIEDREKPVVRCRDLTVQLNASGTAVISAADVDNGSTDNCGSPTLSVSLSAFDCRNLGPNNVTLVAVDASGNKDSCMAVVTVADDNYPVKINASVSQTPLNCFGDLATVTIATTGGVGTLTYELDGVSQNSGVFTGIAAGTYNWRVYDPYHCSDTSGVFTVVQPDELTGVISSDNVTCSSGHDGRIEVAGIGGGVGPYEFTIDGGTSWQSDPSFLNLVPGMYNIQMRDANGCVKVLDPALHIYILTADILVDHVSCAGAADGKITLSNADGGNGVFHFSIDGGVTWTTTADPDGAVFSNLSPGTYNVQVRDAVDTYCEVVLNSALEIEEPQPLAATVDKTDVSCNGANDGEIRITSVSGGWGNYEFSENGKVSWQADSTFSGLAPGSYDVWMRDADHPSCELNLGTYAIAEPELLAATISSVDVSCFGLADGEIHVQNSTGGWGSYEYSIDGGSIWQSSPDFTGLTAGTYDVQIRDAAHVACVVQLDPAYTITQPDALTIASEPTDLVACRGESGALSTTISGGAGTITYRWQKQVSGSWADVSDSGTISGANSNVLSFNSLAVADAGLYRLIVNDACKRDTTVAIQLTVNEIDAVTPATTSTTICEGQNYSLTVSTVGQTPVAYQWQFDSSGAGSWVDLSDGGNLSGTTGSQLTISGASVAQSGKYRVRVTFPSTAGNCILYSDGFERELIVNPLPVVDPIDTIIVCNGDAVPDIVFTGTGTTYSWSNDNTSIGLAASGTGNIGTFTAVNFGTSPVIAHVEVIPSTVLCTGNPITLVIVVNPTPTVSAPAKITFCNGEITSPYALSGTPANVSYRITGGTSIGLADVVGVTEIPSFNSVVGTATLTVVPEANGCSGAPATIEVEVLPSPDATISGGDSVCLGELGVYITLTNPLGEAVEVTYTINGSNTQVLTIPAYSPVQVPVSTNVPGDYVYDLVKVRYIAAPYCDNTTVTGSARVVVNPLPEPSISGPDLVCAHTEGHVYRTEAGMSSYMWNVSSGGRIVGTANADSVVIAWDEAGNKSVSVRYMDTNGCSSPVASIYAVTVQDVPTPTIFGPSGICVDAGEVTFSTQKGMSNYVWDVPDGTITQDNGDNIKVIFSAAGDHTVSVNYTNASGCSADAVTLDATRHTLTVYPGPVPGLAGDAVACTGTEHTYVTESGMSNYVWTVSSGGAIVSGGTFNDNTATVRWNVAGPQTISVNYTDADGCDASTATSLAVTVNQSPDPIITGPDIICAGSPNAQYLTEAGQSNYTWTVSSGGTITAGANSNTVSVTWNSVGNHTISVNYTNADGCWAITPKELAVSAEAEVVPTVTGINALCEGTQTTYTTESGMTEYTWTVTGGTIVGDATGNTVTIHWDNSGSQSVSVQYRALNGCMSVVTSYPVEVWPISEPTLTGATDACLQEEYVYQTDPGMSDYQWIVSSGGIIVGTSSKDTLRVRWTGLGTQWVKVNYTNTYGCRGDVSKQLDVNVHDLTPVSCPTDTTLCITSGVLTLNQALPSGGVYSGPGVSGNQFNPAVAGLGIHTIRYTYTNANNCDTWCEFNIVVEPAPDISNQSITICSGTAVDFNLNSLVPGATFTWTTAHVSGPSVSGMNDCTSGCDTLISDVLVNSSVTSPSGSSGNNAVVVYHVTANNNGCIDDFEVRVTVRPAATVFNLTWNSNFVEDFIEVCTGAQALSDNDIEILDPVTGNLVGPSRIPSSWNPTFLYGPSTEGPWTSAPGHWRGGSYYEWIVDFSVNSRLGYHYFVLRITDPNTGCETYSQPAILNVVSSMDVEAGGPDFMCTSSSPTAYLLEGAYVGGISSVTPQARWSDNGAGGTFSTTSYTANPGDVTYRPPANYVGDITLTLTTVSPGGGCDPVSDDRILTLLPPNSFNGCLTPSDWTSDRNNSNGSLDQGQVPCVLSIVGSDNDSNSSGYEGISHCTGQGVVTFDWSFKAPANSIEWHQTDQVEGGNNGYNSRLYVSPPDNLEVGDLIIVTIHVNANTGNITNNGGFTQIRRDTYGSQATVASFYKIATAADVGMTGSYRFNMSNVSSNDKIYASRVTGHDPNNPIGNSNGTTAYFPYYSGEEGYRNITVGGINVNSGAMLVAALSVGVYNDNVVEYSNSPVGMKTVYYDDNETTVRVATQEFSSAGNTGDRTFSWPSYNSRNRNTMYAAAQIFAINPAVPDVDAAYYSINGNQVLLGDQNGTSGTVTVNVNSGDELGFRVSTQYNTGGEGILTIYNLQVPNDVPVASGESLKTYTECQPAGFNPDTAFVAPTVVDDCDSYSLKPGYPQTSSITTNGCQNEQTRTWVYEDNCGAESNVFTQTVQWTELDPIVMTCPADVDIAACTDPATVEATFNSWKAGFTVSGGCGTLVSNLNEFPVYSDISCGGEITFTLEAHDDCGQVETCTSVFRVQAAADLVISCPADTVIDACADPTAIQQAYNEWKAGFGYTGGCPAYVNDNLSELPALPDLSCGGKIGFHYVVNLGSPSCPNSVDCFSTFEVKAPEPITLNTSPDVTLPLCSDSASIHTAFLIWKLGFGYSGGCDVVTNLDAFPEYTDLRCGGEIAFEFRAHNGAGKCVDEVVDTAYFSVFDPPPLVISCPEDPMLPGCADIVTITEAYNNWVDGFQVSGGCDIQTNIAEVPPLGDLLCDGSLTFTFIARSGDGVCAAADTCTSTFTIGKAEDLAVTCPGDTVVVGCTAADVQTAFDAWIARFGYTGGCQVSATDLSIYSPPQTCGGAVTVEYRVNDRCGQSDICSATFLVQAQPLSVSAPKDTMLDACLSQAEVDNAFNDWLSQFSVSGGCSPSVTNLSMFTPPSVCGGEVVVNYSATDGCGQSALTSAYFRIDIPRDANLNPSFMVPANKTVYKDAVCDADTSPSNTGEPTNLTDNCTSSNLHVSYTDSIAAGSCEGEFTVFRRWTVRDNCANVSTQVQEIYVRDTIPPVIVCPNDTSEYADAFQCHKTGMDLGTPVVSDNCTSTASIIVTNDAPTQIPVGVNIITWTATDACGNVATCTQQVTILDTIPPSIDLNGCKDIEEDAAFNNCSKVPETMVDPVYSDDCWPLDSLVLTYTVTGATTASGIGSAAGLSYNVGVSTVKYVVTDPDGLQDSCSFTVTIKDVTPPIIDVNGCQDVSESAPANQCWKVPTTLVEPDYSDNCYPKGELTLNWKMSGATEGTGTGSVTGERFNVGLTYVTYIVSDPDGNEDSCSFTVRILDVVDPQINIDGCVNVEDTVSDNSCAKISPKIQSPTYSDNCWPVDSLTLTWTMTGATVGTGTGSVENERFNVGLTTVTYVVSDPDGNEASCSFTVRIREIVPPGINVAGCADVTETVASDQCSKIPDSMQDPVISDNCWPEDSLTLTYTVSGATTASGTGSARGLAYNVGVSRVTYVVSDPDGNEDSCSFNVTILHPEVPKANFTCPPDTVRAVSDANACGTNLVLDVLTFVDPCNEIDSVWNNSPYGSSPSDASGFYPVGTTDFYWYITDISGNIDSCAVYVEVSDLPPAITCPGDYVFDADLNQDYATGITLDHPVYGDNCPDPILTYRMELPDGSVVYSAATGINFVPDNSTFMLDTTRIVYTVIDTNGNVDSCSFRVIVRARPIINCPPDTTVYLGVSGCTATFDPGVAELIEGAAPITWTYELVNPDGSVGKTGTYQKTTGNMQPDPFGDYTFSQGNTIIRWRAENNSGFDTCSHVVTVIDTVPPTFTTASYENCVNPIIYAIYNPNNPNPYYGTDANLEKSPSPDYRVFEAGDTSLDIMNLSDNCCAPGEMTIHWRIEFSDVPDPLNPSGPAISHPSIAGTGQPSEYINPSTGLPEDIYLWGDGVNFVTVVHHIFYWVEDCHGNRSPEVMEEIIITPRPQIIKETH